MLAVYRCINGCSAQRIIKAGNSKKKTRVRNFFFFFFFFFLKNKLSFCNFYNIKIRLLTKRIETFAFIYFFLDTKFTEVEPEKKLSSHYI